MSAANQIISGGLLCLSFIFTTQNAWCSNIDIKELSANASDYVGKVVSTRAEVTHAVIDHKQGIINIELRGSGSPRVVIRSPSDLYQQVAKSLPELSDKIEVTGELRPFRDSHDFYIDATKYSRSTLRSVWSKYWSLIVFGFVFSILAIAKAATQTQEDSK